MRSHAVLALDRRLTKALPMPACRLHATDLDVIRHSSENIDITDLNEVIVLN
jgi:hypothetical protein